MGNPTKDIVFERLAELEAAVQRDSFNLTRDSQEMISTQIRELRETINREYGKVMGH